MSKLIACAALVVRLGGLSDAIYYNALAPEIKISSLGDILFRDEFGRLVVEPMLAGVIGERFIANAPLQKRNYEAPDIVPATKGKISDEFWNIWNSENSGRLEQTFFHSKEMKHTWWGKAREGHTFKCRGREGAVEGWMAGPREYRVTGDSQS